MSKRNGKHVFRDRAAASAAALFFCILISASSARAVYADGMSTGTWMEDSTGSWYRHTDGSYTAGGWEYIDGNMYYFDREGYLVRNCLVADGGYMYIVDQDGRMLRDTELTFNGSAYVIDGEGHVRTRALYEAMYGSSNAGQAAGSQSAGAQPAQVQAGSGWRQDAVGSWFVKADGSYPVSAWENINEVWYYFDEQGYMATDRIQAYPDGTLRYLGSDGRPVTDTEVSYDGAEYTVDAEGIATPKEAPKSEEELAAESYAAQIVSAITNAGMTKPQKANAIYNWLRANIRYTTSGPQSDEAYSALYGFRRRSGCCYEYYAMAHYMLEAAGMPNIPVVRATDRGHYWNLVNVDGVWYHFDATPRRLGGRWCLVTTGYLQTHSWSSHNFDISAYPATP